MDLSIPLTKKIISTRSAATKQDAFAQLYQMYARKVYNSVYRIVNEQALAEDILQDAFCTAFEQQERLRDEQKFEGWINRIAINLAISHLRKHQALFLAEDLPEQPAERHYNEAEEMALLQKVADVKAAIQALPTGYRTIVVLHLFEDIPQEEIAGMLNISHSTVRSQYHRAKKKILSMLKVKYDEAR